MSNTNDRELLELAAKAGGMEHMRWCGPAGLSRMLDPTRPDSTGSIGGYWNPLTDDGDALRLAVQCGLVVDTSRPSAGEPFKSQWVGQADFTDLRAATRRAITRAAAEIGRTAPAERTQA